MSKTDNDIPPPAKVAPLRRISPLWLIPLVTLAVGAWMVYDNWTKQGPLITIEFSTAEGLEEGLEKGREEGREEGKKEEKIEIAKNLKQAGVAIDIIQASTGLSSEEIKAL